MQEGRQKGHVMSDWIIQLVTEKENYGETLDVRKGWGLMVQQPVVN